VDQAIAHHFLIISALLYLLNCQTWEQCKTKYFVSRRVKCDGFRSHTMQQWIDDNGKDDDDDDVMIVVIDDTPLSCSVYGPGYEANHSVPLEPSLDL